MTSTPGRHRWRPSKDAQKVIKFFVGVVGFASAVLAFAQLLGWLRGGLLLLAAAAFLTAIAAWLYTGPTMRSRPTAGGVVVAVASLLVAIGCTIAFVLTHTDDTQRLMRQWDGKFAKDVDACAQDDPASVAIPGLKPDVIGPDGTVIAQIHLRTFAKRECPPAVWAWVPWHGDPAARLPVPEGWTVHVVVRRDKTGTKLDATEPSSGQAVPYPISKILIATADAGCVAVDVFFTNDAGAAPPTPTATTGCVFAQ